MPSTLSKSSRGSSGSSRLAGIDLAYILSVFGCIFVSYFFVIGNRVGFLDHMHYFPLLDIFPAWFIFMNGMTTTLNLRNKKISSRRLTSFMGKKGTILLLLGLIFAPVWPLDILVVCGLFYIAAPFLSSLNTSILRAIALLSGLLSIALLTFTKINATIHYSPLMLQGSSWSELGSFLFFNGYYSALPWFTFFVLGLIHGRGEIRVRDIFVPSNLSAFFWLLLALLAQYLAGEFYSGKTQILASDYFPVKDKVYLPSFLLIGAASSVMFTNGCIYLLKRNENKKILDFLHTLSGMKYSVLLFHLILGVISLAVFEHAAFSNKFYLMGYIIILNFLIAWLVFWWKKKINNLGPAEWLTKRITGSGSS